MNCASCHIQEAGFSDPGKALSIGVQGKPGFRNSPALANLAWVPAFMADGGINHIEVMPIAPITDSLEMNISLKETVAKLQASAQYPPQFKRAFGSDSITDQKMLFGLAQFMSTMVSANSKYDEVVNGKAVFTEKEKRGFSLFKQNCSSCHKQPLFTDFSYRSNGLDENSKDPGRGRITQQAEDHGKFKVPSLRNVQLSAPYMHDGRFTNLEEVLNHYSDGIQTNASLDHSLVGGISLSAAEKADIIAFLYTLTDYKFITNNNLSNPTN